MYENDKAELVKMLYPGSVPFERLAKGKSNFNWENIAGALAKMDKTTALYARYKYGNQKELRKQLEYHIFYPHVVDIFVRHNWPSGHMRALTKLLIDESCAMESCNRCNGSGLALINKKYQTCTTCKGTGRYRFNQAKRAKCLGISKPAWNKTWELRYNTLLFCQTILNFEKSINACLLKQIN